MSYKKTQKNNSTGNQENNTGTYEKFNKEIEIIKENQEIVEMKISSQTLPKN